MTTPQGDVNAIQVGAGRILIGPVGSTEPTDLVTPWDPDWLELGFTKQGTSQKIDRTIDDTFVEELLDPVRGITTKRTFAMIFDLAQITATNLKRALNGQSIFTQTGTVTTFEPPTYGGEVYMAWGWESTDNTERFVLRKCLQTGTVQMDRRNKVADPTSIPFEVHAYGVNAGGPFKYLAAAPRN